MRQITHLLSRYQPTDVTVTMKITRDAMLNTRFTGVKLWYGCTMKHSESRVSVSSKASQRYVHQGLYRLVAKLAHKGPSSVRHASS